MTQMVIPLNETDANAPLRVDVHVEAEVLGSEVARRKANVWLLINAGNLLGAENPRLCVEERLLWEVDVVLTWPTRGCMGTVGQLRLDAKTGEVLADEWTLQAIGESADALATG